MEVDEIDEVVIVGGTTRIPKVQEELKRIFNKEHLYNSVNPDEAIARGAAVMAAQIANQINSSVIVSDVLPIPIGLKLANDEFDKLLEAGVTFPCKSKEMEYQTQRKDQNAMKLIVLQGTSEQASENVEIAKTRLINIPPGEAGEQKINVTFAIDKNGLFSVEAEAQGDSNVSTRLNVELNSVNLT